MIATIAFLLVNWIDLHRGRTSLSVRHGIHRLPNSVVYLLVPGTIFCLHNFVS